MQNVDIMGFRARDSLTLYVPDSLVNERARILRMVLTEMRRRRIQGLPPHTPGSIVIRSEISGMS